MLLSARIEGFRTNRPDEWTMDEFARQARALEDALKDARAGLQYIQETSPDTYGVGFDRVYDKAAKALEEQSTTNPELITPIQESTECTADEMDAMREWVRAEIAYEFASNEEGSDGYRQSAHGERDYAENCFQILKSMAVN